MLSQSDLDAIRSRAEAASPGKWQGTWNDGPSGFVHVYHDGVGQYVANSILTEPDATFIAHARTDVPELLSTIADTRAELVKYFDDIDVDYEGEPNDLDTMVRQAAGQLHEARSWSGKETERANVAEARIAELEAAQVPRDMVDAPRDGEFWSIVPLRYCEHASEEWGQPTYIDRDDGLWATPSDDDMFLGWLPLPDQKSGVVK